MNYECMLIEYLLKISELLNMYQFGDNIMLLIYNSYNSNTIFYYIDPYL